VAGALRPNAATLNLVKSQVGALLTSSAAFHALPPEERRSLSDNLTRVAAYSAELIRDDWYQSGRIGQRPVVRYRKTIEGPAAQSLAQAQSDEGSGFAPSATSQVARVTQETIRAIAFPTFVADLIKGTFQAIVNASIQQMEAYIRLIENVSKTVDQFMNDNISDNQAKDWLAQSYPDHIVVEGGRAVPRPDADDRPAPNFRADLNLSEEVSLDEGSIEETLVPAARRKLAQGRHQMLSTMVLMGINRIVVTGGKIRATMGFHIDATDRAHAERATDFDFRAAASGSFGFGPWSASLSTSVSYVSSTRRTNDSELNVDADLTGEVEIHFKSDVFPLERFAPAGTINRIQSHTPVPEANTPPPAPFSEPPAVGGDVGRYQSARTRRTQPQPSQLRPIGSPLPEVRRPVAPDAPVVERRVDGVGAGGAGGSAGGEGGADGGTAAGGGGTASEGGGTSGEGGAATPAHGGESGGESGTPSNQPAHTPAPGSTDAPAGDAHASTPGDNTAQPESPAQTPHAESNRGASNSSAGGQDGVGGVVRNVVGNVVGQVGNAVGGAVGNAVGGLMTGAVGRPRQPRR
jgi:hypothetical protein